MEPTTIIQRLYASKFVRFFTRTNRYGVFFVWVVKTAVLLEFFFSIIADRIREFATGQPVNLIFPAMINAWIIPTYGLSAIVSFVLIQKCLPSLFKWPWFLRGITFIFGIFAWEIILGAPFEYMLGVCPWQYTDSDFWLLRYIDPWHAIAWFPLGFLLQWGWNKAGDIANPRVG